MTNHHLLMSLKTHEGFRTQPYKCTAGVWTVGYGHNLEAGGVPRRYCPYVRVTRHEADALLRADIFDAIDDAHRFDEFAMLDCEERQNVIIEMVFNLGYVRLSKFKKMWAAIAQQNWELATIEMMDSKWAEQVGNRAKRLGRQMLNGEYET